MSPAGGDRARRGGWRGGGAVTLPERVRALRRPIVVAVLVVSAIAATAGTSAAATPTLHSGLLGTPHQPRTSAEALAQLRAFNDEFERVTEQYNYENILLAKRQRDAR